MAKAAKKSRKKSTAKTAKKTRCPRKKTGDEDASAQRAAEAAPEPDDAQLDATENPDNARDEE